MVPQSLFSHLIFTFLKSKGQLFRWMSFNLGLSSFLMIKFRLCFLASISHSNGVPVHALYQVITSYWFVPLLWYWPNHLVMTKVMTSRFSNVQLPFFLLWSIGTPKDKLWDYLNILFPIKHSPTNFSIHWWIMLESIIIV